jgi:molecular chaperone DnaJ
MPVLRGRNVAGDLTIEVRVETPTKLSKKQKELLKAFAADSDGTQPESDGFFAKVKDFLAGSVH